MRRITQTLEISRRVEGEPDRYGNPTESWEPLAWPVFAVAPRGEAADPAEPNRDVVVHGLAVHAPIDGPRPGANDRVVHRGIDYEVMGDVGTWDNNPHVPTTRHHGIVVNLERTEG